MTARRWLVHHPRFVAALFILAGMFLFEALVGRSCEGAEVVLEPTAMTLAIAYGTGEAAHRTIQRPVLGHCFTVQIDPAFTAAEEDVIRGAMVAGTGLSGGDVGFDLACGRPTLSIDREYPHVMADGRVITGYAGLAYIDVVGDVIVSARLVINPRWIAPKVVMHELAHVLGFQHPNLPGSVMSDLDLYADLPAEVDYEAWRWMREQAPGTGPRASIMSASGRQTVVVVN